MGALLDSGLPLNECLSGLCKRAVGTPAFTAMVTARNAARTTRARSSVVGGWRAPPASAPEAAEAGGSGGRIADAMEDAAAVDGDAGGDGWTTVSSGKRGGGGGARKAVPSRPTRAERVSAETRLLQAIKSPIKKPKPPAERQPTKSESVAARRGEGGAAASSAPAVKLVGGVKLTRSHSARAELLSLAKVRLLRAHLRLASLTPPSRLRHDSIAAPGSPSRLASARLMTCSWMTHYLAFASAGCCQRRRRLDFGSA